jgi:hypothetical protein
VELRGTLPVDRWSRIGEGVEFVGKAEADDVVVKTRAQVRKPAKRRKNWSSEGRIVTEVDIQVFGSDRHSIMASSSIDGFPNFAAVSFLQL